MHAFPTVHELAAVIDDAVNTQWAVLGCYPRARYLYQGAKYANIGYWSVSY